VKQAGQAGMKTAEKYRKWRNREKSGVSEIGALRIGISVWRKHHISGKASTGRK